MRGNRSWSKCKHAGTKLRRLQSPKLWATVVCGLVPLILLVNYAQSRGNTQNGRPFLDPTGLVSTYSTAGFIDTDNPFFQSLGANGRTCASCHVQSTAFGLSAHDAQRRFLESRGKDPLFAPVDGANCPDVSTGDAAGHSLMLKNGLVRVSLPVPQPPTAQYTISVVHDPYGCALVTDPNTGQQTISVYRRPLPSTNLRFLSAVMLDARETHSPLTDQATFLANLKSDLSSQAVDATTGHAQATTPPTPAQVAAIVNFELGLFSAQRVSFAAGALNAHGAKGGAEYISDLPYYPGINDPLGGNPTSLPFDPSSMALFSAWSNAHDEGRRKVAAGEVLFDTLPLKVTGVRGLNDNPALGNPTVITATCTTCHDSPNVGNHSLPLALDIGTSHAADKESDEQIAGALSQLSVPDLPIYKVTCIDPSSPNVGQVFYTSDPGKALIPKHGVAPCTDINRIKGPVLRALAARAPYFHNGSARDLNEVIEFYNQRFQMGMTQQQKAELVAFLNSL